jgi:Uma2 family endonuclease
MRREKRLDQLDHRATLPATMGANDHPVLLQRHRLTVDEYYRMGDAGILAPDARVELIEGEVIDMAPMKSAHAGMVNLLARCLYRAAGDNADVTCQTPLRLGTRSEPQPDLMLVRPRPDAYTSSHPTAADVLLLIEVADSSLGYDTVIKLPLYARHRVPEVWIVDLEHRRVQCFRRPECEDYVEASILETPGALPVGLLPQVNVDLSGLFPQPAA